MVAAIAISRNSRTYGHDRVQMLRFLVAVVGTWFMGLVEESLSFFIVFGLHHGQMLRER
jgi:hypothetical protein